MAYTITIEIEDQHRKLNIGERERFGHIDIDFARLPPAALTYLFNYGVKKAFNDKHADTTDKKTGYRLPADKIVEKVQSKLDNLYKGIIRSPKRRVTGDEYERLCYTEMRDEQYKRFAQKGYFKDCPKTVKYADRLMWFVNKTLRDNNRPEITEQAYIAQLLTTPLGETIKAQVQRMLDERAEREDIGDDEDVLAIIEGVN